MANELSFANLETDAGLAHYLAGQIKAKLYDPTDLRATMMRRDFRAGMGSESTKVSQYNRGHVFAAVTSEIVGGASNADIGSGNFQHTIARRMLKFSMTDLWRLVAPNGSLDLDLLAGIFVEGTGLTITDMLCTLFTAISSNVGSSTADFSVDFLYDGQFKLNLARVPAPYNCVLRPKAWNELQASGRTEQGVFQFQAASAELIKARGPGYKGEINNIRIWDSDSVNADGGGTYYRSAMFGQDAFEYQEAPAVDVSAVLPPNVFRIDAGGVLIVHDYDADNAITAVIGNYYPSAVATEAARAVEIRSQVA